MHTCSGSANRVLGVHRIRQRDVDGNHRLQTFVEFVVVEGAIEPVALRELPTLGAVPAHDGGQPGVSARMCERRKHGDLRDMAQTDDGVADRTFRSWHSMSS
jgi:hypothetical protein